MSSRPDGHRTAAAAAAEPLPCVICAAPTVPLFAKDGWWVRECCACGHREAATAADGEHVARTYGDDYFAGGGAGYADYLSEGALLRAHGRRYARLLTRFIARPGRMLDVGAAAGFVLQGFQDAGWTGMGVEPNAAMVAWGRRELGLDLRQGTLESLDLPATFDLVTLIQVVAHFADPRAALAAAFRVTKPGGFWLIETWNRRSMTARVLGRHWHEYSPPSVLHWFSPEGLGRLAGDLGMREVGRGRPTKRLNGGHAKSLLRHKLGGSVPGRAALALLAVVPDSLPIPYPSEDLFWACYERPA